MGAPTFQELSLQREKADCLNQLARTAMVGRGVCQARGARLAMKRECDFELRPLKEIRPFFPLRAE